MKHCPARLQDLNLALQEHLTLSVDWIANDERATGFGSSEFNFLERSQIVQVLELPDGCWT
jgi:hypothetical protein